MQKASERAAAIRAEQERKERRTRTLLVSSVVIAVLLIVTVFGYLFMSGRDTTGQTAEPPAGVVDTYALAMGDANAPVKVTVYEDPMCPFCGIFERAGSERLKEYADSGDVQVRYHLVSFLDDASTTDYSTRAVNAVGVVLDTAGPEVALKFHDALYANQPAERGPGLSDDRLVELAVKAGADEQAIAGPIADLKFEQWVVNATDEWSSRGFTGTPAVTVNGRKVDSNSAEELPADTEAAIKEELAQ
jgi:protein-disulfide isomerase